MILPETYKSIADHIADIQGVLDNTETFIDDMLSTLEVLQSFFLVSRPDLGFGSTLNDTDFFQPMITNLELLKSKSSTPKIDSLIISLQEHILARNSSIDLFLSSNGIKVKQDFADLSNNLGYAISSSNIE